MSDLLTHWAVFEDCRRLASGDPDIDPTLQEIIDSEREYARLGAITRDGNAFMAPLLLSLRQRWRDEATEDRLRGKVAFILGCLTHQACDNAMKPLISRAAGGDWSRAHTDIWAGKPGARERFEPHNEISAYYDTYVFKKVYLAGAEEPFVTEFLADASGRSDEALEQFVRSLFQRALLSSHTLKPDLGDPERWLDDLFDRYQELYVDIRTYVRVFNHPDPEKMREFAVESEFYRDDDPIIQAARSAQALGSTPELSREMFAADHNKSHYARALALGLEYLRSASALWCGRTTDLDTPNWDGVIAEEVEQGLTH